jgi:hypothetical protein
MLCLISPLNEWCACARGVLVPSRALWLVVVLLAGAWDVVPALFCCGLDCLRCGAVHAASSVLPLQSWC